MIIKLEISNLCFSYASHAIFRNFCLNVGDGQIVSLVGPNGSGKSTLIKCIDNLLAPSAGEILVDRKKVGQMTRLELARAVAYVPQSSLRVFPNTVFDVALMGRRPHLSWKCGKEDEDIVWSTLELLGVQDLAMSAFNELSGGQQQKVLIARALAQETGLLLLDEPTSNLDLWHQLDVMETLRALVKNYRITALIAIHDLNIASRYSDSIIMMKHGAIASAGKPETVLTSRNLESVYGVKATVKTIDEKPHVIPLARIADAHSAPRKGDHAHSRK